MTLHTDGEDLGWGFAPHQELGYAFGEVAADLENKVISFTGSGTTFIDQEDLGGGAVTARLWAEHVLPEAKRLLTNLMEIQAPMIAAVNLACSATSSSPRTTPPAAMRRTIRSVSCPVTACP